MPKVIHIRRRRRSKSYHDLSRPFENLPEHEKKLPSLMFAPVKPKPVYEKGVPLSDLIKKLKPEKQFK